MAVGRVTPEMSRGQDNPEAGQEASPNQGSDQKPPSEPTKGRAQPSGLTQLTTAFTQRRTVVFAVCMGVVMYSVGAVLLFVGIHFTLRDFLVMGSGSVIIGTIFLGVIIGLRIRDRQLAKKALLPGHALVKTADDGYVKYSLADGPLKAVTPATKAVSTSSLSRPQNSPTREFESEVPHKENDSHKRNSVGTTDLAKDCAIPHAARYDRGSSQETMGTEDDISLNSYQVNESNGGIPPPPVALPRAVTSDSLTVSPTKDPEISESIYTEPIQVAEADSPAPPKTQTTPSFAFTTKSGLVTPSDIETSTVTPSEVERSVLSRVKILESGYDNDNRTNSPCDSEA